MDQESPIHDIIYFSVEKKTITGSVSLHWIVACTTSHQLIEFTHEIMQSLDNQQLICLVFCDDSKAVDRVWLRDLLLKLERYGIKGMLLRWLKIYISNREQQVIIKDTISLKGNLKVRVPQAQSLVLYCFWYLLMKLPMICLDCVDCLLMTRPLAKDHLKIIICVLWLTLIYTNIMRGAKLWLIKLNPEKREIVYFSTRLYLLDLYFSVDNVKFKTADAHQCCL